MALGRANVWMSSEIINTWLWVCVFACMFVWLFVSLVCVCQGGRGGGTREQFPAPGEIYCISSKVADAGESMGVYIRESIPRGSIARFTISKTCTTVTSSLSLELDISFTLSLNLICLWWLNTERHTWVFQTICKVNIIQNTVQFKGLSNKKNNVPAEMCIIN